MRFTAVVEVAATQERVFPYLDDPELLKKWVPGLESLTFEKPGVPRAVGTRFRQRMRIASKAVEFEGEVIAYRPPGEIGVRLSESMLTLETTFRLARSDGWTSVERVTDVTVHSWQARLTAPFAIWYVQRLNKLSLNRLRSVIERASA